MGQIKRLNRVLGYKSQSLGATGKERHADQPLYTVLPNDLFPFCMFGAVTPAPSCLRLSILYGLERKREPNLDFLSWSHMPNLESFQCQQQHLNLIWALVCGYELYSAILWQRQKPILLGEDVTPLVMGPFFACLNTSVFFHHGSSVEEECRRGLCIWVAFNCDTLIHFLPPANKQDSSTGKIFGRKKLCDLVSKNWLSKHGIKLKLYRQIFKIM